MEGFAAEGDVNWDPGREVRADSQPKMCPTKQPKWEFPEMRKPVGVTERLPGQYRHFSRALCYLLSCSKRLVLPCPCRRNDLDNIFAAVSMPQGGVTSVRLACWFTKRNTKSANKKQTSCCQAPFTLDLGLPDLLHRKGTSA